MVNNYVYNIAKAIGDAQTVDEALENARRWGESNPRLRAAVIEVDLAWRVSKLWEVVEKREEFEIVTFHAEPGKSTRAIHPYDSDKGYCLYADPVDVLNLLDGT